MIDSNYTFDPKGLSEELLRTISEIELEKILNIGSNKKKGLYEDLHIAVGGKLLECLKINVINELNRKRNKEINYE